MIESKACDGMDVRSSHMDRGRDLIDRCSFDIIVVVLNGSGTREYCRSVTDEDVSVLGIRFAILNLIAFGRTANKL